MKLRIKGNSIRLRLGRSEVVRLAADGIAEEFTVFGPRETDQFSYAIFASPARAGVRASFDGRRIVVRVPWEAIRQWAATNEVSIHALQTHGDTEMAILIEKDFECVEVPPGESQADAFARSELRVADAGVAGAAACAGSSND